MTVQAAAHALFVHHRTPNDTSPNEPHIIGMNVSLSGILQVEGDVWVDGNLEADIRCRHLLIAPRASIDGVVVAETVEVFGTVLGEVYCYKVIVKNDARIEAELNYRDLELEPGGLFEGRSRRYDDPISHAPTFA